MEKRINTVGSKIVRKKNKSEINLSQKQYREIDNLLAENNMCNK